MNAVVKNLLLDLPAAAAELETGEVSILRLIARGDLRAGFIPPDKWRIVPDDLFDFIRRGAPNFKNMRDDEANPFSERMGNWFEFCNREIERAVINAASSQFLSDNRLESTARARLGAGTAGPGGVVPKRQSTLELSLDVTPEVSAVLENLFRSKFRVPGTDYDRFGPAGDLWIAGRLVIALGALWRTAKGNGRLGANVGGVEANPALAWLYATPDGYKDIVRQVVIEAAQTRLETTVIKTFPDRGGPMAGEVQVSITYYLPTSKWATTARIQAASDKLL